MIIDIVYDYMLIKQWERYSNVTLDCFIDRFHVDAATAIKRYPANARDFVQRIIDYQVLASYGSFGGLQAAFGRIDARLSQRLLAKESATDYIPVLKNQINAIEDDFSQFFPRLVDCFKARTEPLRKGHWLR